MLEKHTLAFPIGRQKLESRTSAETGKDSPYLDANQNTDPNFNNDRISIQSQTSRLQTKLTATHFQGRLQDQGL